MEWLPPPQPAVATAPTTIVDPVTGEEGYFDGNNVWITAGFVDEGGFYIEAAGQKIT